MGAYDKGLPTLNTRKTARGKYGAIYDEEGNYMDNVTEFEAKIKFDKKKVERGNAFLDGHRIMGGTATGKMKIYLTNAKFKQQLAEDPDRQYNFVGEVHEVDGMAVEANYRIALKGINFDEVDLHTYKTKDLIELDLPFTFEDYEYL